MIGEGPQWVRRRTILYRVEIGSSGWIADLRQAPANGEVAPIAAVRGIATEPRDWTFPSFAPKFYTD